MRRFRFVLVLAVAASGVVALAPAAHADAPRASDAVCDKIMLEEADLGGLGGKKFVAAEFTDAGKAFKAGAKAAPAKVKKAMTTMAGYYRKLGEADSANEAVSSITAGDTTKFGKASVVWGTYVATECSG